MCAGIGNWVLLASSFPVKRKDFGFLTLTTSSLNGKVLNSFFSSPSAEIDTANTAIANSFLTMLINF